MSSAGILPVFAIALVTLWIGVSGAATARSMADGITGCLAMTADDARLACFDREALKLLAPRFEGRLNAVTEVFEVSVPTWLRFQSDGAIFVLYLKSAAGEVVQNLHLGGGGEDRYLIETPGRYRLQINGSEGWRIWLEPSRQQ